MRIPYWKGNDSGGDWHPGWGGGSNTYIYIYQILWYMYIYIYLYLKPQRPLFLKVNPSKQGLLLKQNKGPHLGSRYIEILAGGFKYLFLSPLLPTWGGFPFWLVFSKGLVQPPTSIIQHHLGCIRPCKYWARLPINWCRISSINSITEKT